MNYICLNPYCDYCIDQVEFEEAERCPKCNMTKVAPSDMKKYLPPELLNELKRLRDRGEMLKANIICLDMAE